LFCARETGTSILVGSTSWRYSRDIGLAYEASLSNKLSGGY
jgi:hypothetical protein